MPGEKLGDLALLRLDHAANEQASFHWGVAQHCIFDRAKGDNLFAIPGDHRRRGDLRSVANHQVDFPVFLIGPKAAILTLQILRKQIDHRSFECLGHFFGQVSSHVSLGASELRRRCRCPKGVKVGRRLENAVMQQIGVQRDVFGIVPDGRGIGVIWGGIRIENNAAATGLVQDKLHALASTKLSNAMQIGDHSSVPTRNGAFEIRDQSFTNGRCIAFERQREVIFAKVPNEQCPHESRIDGLEELRIYKLLEIGTHGNTSQTAALF
ncbi:hypothetical protein D1114_23510 [Cereibacter sphaeroides]|uniref:Uncharacterized protein n=1 Tax=Cereibacter sphaeroides TaxID=1063 RepID=A0AAX1UE47_CERSP|nr:hypothetical protein D1114_23510 [Cereibacter sphaeroides]